MSTADIAEEFAHHPTAPAFLELYRSQMEQMLAAADALRKWEREKLVIVEPDAATLSEHKKMARMILFMLKLLNLSAAHPDFPEKSFAPEIEFRIRQLEDSVDMFHNPMPEAEADRLLAMIFPE